jgi:hypothetical protein
LPSTAARSTAISTTMWPRLAVQIVTNSWDTKRIVKQLLTLRGHVSRKEAPNQRAERSLRGLPIPASGSTRRGRSDSPSSA